MDESIQFGIAEIVPGAARLAFTRMGPADESTNVAREELWQGVICIPAGTTVSARRNSFTELLYVVRGELKVTVLEIGDSSASPPVPGNAVSYPDGMAVPVAPGTPITLRAGQSAFLDNIRAAFENPSATETTELVSTAALDHGSPTNHGWRP